jgi:hypothetical protein
MLPNGRAKRLIPPGSRALSKLGINDAAAPSHVRGILESEPAAGDIKSKISTWIQELPDWLLHLCDAHLSMNILGIKRPSCSESVFEFKLAKSDKNAWPLLPQGVLEPNQSNRYRFEMSLEEAMRYLDISGKPEEGWTRHERRFIRDIDARALTSVLDSMRKRSKRQATRMMVRARRASGNEDDE